MLCCGFVYQDVSLNLLFFMTSKLAQGKKKASYFFSCDYQSHMIQSVQFHKHLSNFAKGKRKRGYVK